MESLDPLKKPSARAPTPFALTESGENKTSIAKEKTSIHEFSLSRIMPAPILAPVTNNLVRRSVTEREARERFVKFLGVKGLRVTDQRMAIFDAAVGRKQHFTAEDLLVDARAIDSSVSRATVYRSLPILVESGLVREVDLGRDFKYYASACGSAAFQAQIACPDCAKIVEVDAPFMEWYGKTMAGKHNMELVSQRLQIIARCKDCAGKSRPPTPPSVPPA